MIKRERAPLLIRIRSGRASYKMRRTAPLGVVTLAMIFVCSNAAVSENTLKALSVSTSSPVELVLIDPQGRKSGYDPVTKTLFEDIPVSAYNTSQSCDEQGSGGCNPPFKTLSMANQMDGQYTLDVIGTGTGDFAVEVSMSDAAGNWISHFYSGTTAPGRISQFTFPGKVIAFTAFGATVRISSASTVFEVNGTFTVGQGGEISLLTQLVSIQLHDLMLTIPVGSFGQTRQGSFVFAGIIDGVQLTAEVTQTGEMSYTFRIKGAGVPQLPNLLNVNPVDVKLSIGNNGASSSVNADIVP